MARFIYVIVVSAIFYFIMKKTYKVKELKKQEDKLIVSGDYENKRAILENELDSFCMLTTIAFFSMMYFGLIISIIISVILSLVYPKLSMNNNK